MFLAKKLNRGAGTPAAPADAQFNYVTMLLHGDGTNGAQNNTFVDGSTNNFTITRNGNTTQGSFSPYGSNWSNFFSYNTTATNFLVSNSLSLSGTFTIEGYVYWDGVGSAADMVTLGDSSLSTGLEINISSGNWIFYADAAIRITGSAAIVGQWTYLAVTRSGSTVTLYINGVSQGTWTSSTTFSGTIKVGASFYNGTYYASMSGYISNLRVNNTTAINAVPTVPLTAVSGTIFLTCQSNRFIDNSTNNYAITVNGTPSVQRFNPFGASTAYDTSVIGGSGYFDGTGDYLSFASGTGFDVQTGNFTIECWINPNSTSQSGVVGNLTNNNGLAQWQIFINYAPSNKQIIFLYGTSTSYLGNVLIGGNTGTLSIGSWNHIAITRSATTIRVFLNGVVVATDTTGNSFYNNNPNSYKIGSHGDSSEYTNGYITDVRVIQGTALYTSAFTPPTAPLTAVSGTSVLTNMTNGAIFDNAMMNDLETVGNAQISTSVVKYGTGSIFCSTSSDYLKPPNSYSAAVGTGDFTIEFWYYASTLLGSYQPILDTRNTSATATGFFIGLDASGKPDFYTNGADRCLNGSAISTGIWYHISVCRASGSTKLFVNGTQGGSTYTDTNNYSNQQLRIGNNFDNTIGMSGYIDDLRITKGYARYTATFTPPTAALLDTGPY